jgi:phosphoribosylformylglycinamidine synthase
MGGLGAAVEWRGSASSLFAEVQSRVVVSSGEEQTSRILELASEFGIPVLRLGVVGGSDLCVRYGDCGDKEFRFGVEQIAGIWTNAIPRLMKAAG